MHILVVEIVHQSETASWEEMSADVGLLELDKEMFDSFMEREDVNKLLDELDIRHDNRVDLFSVLDSDGGSSLSVAEILKGFTMLRGDPRRTDVVSVGLILRSLQDHQQLELRVLKEMHEDHAVFLHNFRNEIRTAMGSLQMV